MSHESHTDDYESTDLRSVDSSTNSNRHQVDPKAWASVQFTRDDAVVFTGQTHDEKLKSDLFVEVVR